MGNQVAQTILYQLNGHKFVVMTGARNLASTDNSLSFKIGRNAGGYNHIQIVLNSLDLYDVHFIKIRKYKIIKEDIVNNVYSDMLRDVFTEKTGLYTNL